MHSIFKQGLIAVFGAWLVFSSAWGEEPPAAVSDPPLPANASITMAYYRNFFSGSMNHLMQLVEDKIEPSGSVRLPTLEARDWWTQQRTTGLSRLYALNLYGLIVPDADGAYRFYADARGQMRFFLSTDEQDAHARHVLFAPADKNQKDKKKPYNLVSDPVELRAGRRYFVRVLFIPGWRERLNIKWARVEVDSPDRAQAAVQSHSGPGDHGQVQAQTKAQKDPEN